MCMSRRRPSSAIYTVQKPQTSADVTAKTRRLRRSGRPLRYIRIIGPLRLASSFISSTRRTDSSFGSLKPRMTVYQCVIRLPCQVLLMNDDDDESMKLVFAHSYSLETVTSVLMKICSGKQFSFYAPQLVPAGTAEARISYGNSVCPSVRPSVRLSRPGGIPSPGEIEIPRLHHMIAQSL